ncbi:alpha/beta hydrolase family protein [Aquipuribacter nitratireducens]|uniref:Alpha/beta hydrolase family protein n=1 Tax=Aquipuribacter nitratireducens TaxID=650104 RepID=A0ABW0GN60_9MICO
MSTATADPGSRALPDGTPPEEAGAREGRRRPRWQRVVLWLVSGLVLAVLGVVFGVAWYFSGLALAVDRAGAPPVPVVAGADGTVVLPDTFGTDTRGRHGIRWQAGTDSGWGVTGDVVERGDGRVVREWEDRSGALPDAGATGALDQDVFLGDPGVVGLDFEEVVLDSDLGPLPAYRVPAPADPTPEQARATGTWIVFVHGRGGQREEANRYLPLWHGLGFEVLTTAYRNDTVAPQDPSGRYGLGATEWRDVAVALDYAEAQGAESVVLAGWSMGGAIALQTLAQADDADLVEALVLDAPVVDWRDTFHHQGELAGLPRWWTSVALVLTELRGSLDLDDLDWVARADELAVPVYLVHSDDDAFVPNGPSRELAELRPDLVTPRFTGPADHTREWNVDPRAYEGDMRRWLVTTVLAD